MTGTNKNKNVYIICIFIIVFMVISTIISYISVQNDRELFNYKCDFESVKNTNAIYGYEDIPYASQNGSAIPYKEEAGSSGAEINIVQDENDPGGRYVAQINCDDTANDARIVYRFQVASSYYKFSCDIKTENIGKDHIGANISIANENFYIGDIRGTTDWTHVEGYVKSLINYNTVYSFLRIGGNSDYNTGKAYFYNFKIEEVRALPQNVDANSVGTVGSNISHDEYNYLIGYIFLFIIIAGVLCLIYITIKKSASTPLFYGENALFIIFAAALIVRLVIAPYINGFEGDVYTFKTWGQVMASNPVRFYDIVKSGAYDLQCDYPPLYIYILAIISKILQLFQVGFDSFTYKLAVKLPVLIADMVSAGFIYKICGKIEKSEKGKWMKPGWKIFFAALYLFNPMVLFDSVVWGQVDSILAMFLILAVYAIMNKRTVTSSILFGIAIMIKPQALFAGPVLLYFVIKSYNDGNEEDGDNRKNIRETLAFKLMYILSIAAMVFFPYITDNVIPMGNYNKFSLIGLLFGPYFSYAGYPGTTDLRFSPNFGQISSPGLLILILPFLLAIINLIIMFIPKKFNKGNLNNKSRYFINMAVAGISAFFHVMFLVFAIYLPETSGKLMGNTGLALAGGFYFNFAISVFMLITSFIVYKNEVKQTFAKLKNVFINFTKAGATILITIFAITIPYTFENMFFITNLFQYSTEHYPYVSVNGFNFFTFLGYNWAPDNQKALFGVSLYGWGIIFIMAMVLAGFILYMVLPKNYKAKPFLIGLFLLVGIYCFSVRMHERYLFPAIIFSLIIILLDNNKFMMKIYWLLTLSIFLNSIWVLGRYTTGQNIWFLDQPLIMYIISALNIFVFSLIIMYIILKIINKNDFKMVEEVYDP